ncbi:hypothetical protein ACWOAH_08445, partial [Vagococcus vulneris]
MFQKKLIHNWTLKSNNDNIQLLQNDDGYLAVIPVPQTFNDPQPLLMKISEDSLALLSYPHFIQEFSINCQSSTLTNMFYEYIFTEQDELTNHNQNLQCELEVCSSAESLYCRPEPKRLTEKVSLMHHIHSLIL